MKKTIIMLTIMLTTLLRAQTSFTVGTNSVPVIFEDAQLSQTNRVLICNDLNRVFAFATNFTNLIVYLGTPIGDDIGYLKDIAVNIYPFKAVPGIGKINNKYALLMQKEISERYLKCFTDMETQTNLLQQADAFVAMLNAGGAVNLAAEQKAKLCWVPEGYDQGTPEQHSVFAGYLSDYVFSPPSILSAEWLEVDLYPGKHLSMGVIAAPKNDLSKVFDMPIVYDGTQWRFVRL